MKKCIMVCAMLAVFCCGCAAVTRGLPAAERREKMQQVHKGMTRAEVVTLMGKPYKTEMYPSNKEVLFYYTEWQADGYTTDDEFTPIVLENDVVIGWGWSFDFLKDRQQQIKQLRVSN